MIGGNEILQNAGTISHKQAIKKANEEYQKYKLLEKTKNELTYCRKTFYRTN